MLQHIRWFSRKLGNTTGQPLTPKFRVTVAVALFALALVGLDVWRIVASRESTLSDARVNLENMVRLIAEQADSTFELTDTLLVSEVARLQAAPIDAALRIRMNKSLTAVTENSPRILVISVFDEQGNWLINSSPTPPDLSQNFADRAYFQHHKADASKDLHIGVPVQRKTSGQWAITLSRRWNKPDGSFGGVVIAAITLDYLQQFFQTLDIGRDGVLALHRADAITLARRPYVEANVGKSVAKGDMFSKYLPQSPFGTYRIKALLDGGDRYASYRRLTRYPIVASAALNMDEILASWRRESVINLTLLTLLLVMAGVLARRLEAQLHRRESAEKEVQQVNTDLQEALHETERSHAQLQQSEYFMGSLLDNMPGMVAYWTKDLKCAFANRHYLEWFGRSKEEMRGVTMPSLLGPELFGKNEPMIRGALRGERQQFERTLSKSDGSIGHTLAQYIPTLENGEVRGFLTLVADVTELKSVQIHLEQVNAALEQRGVQLEAASLAKSQFLANMSHEIRTPMNAVLGMVQLLEKTSLSKQQSDYLGKTQLAAKALLGILNDILDFSKIDAGKMELEVVPFALDSLLRSLAAMLAGGVGSKPLEVLFDIDPRLPSQLTGDAMRLQQVLLNLSSNAIKFTPQGEVVIALKLQSQDSETVTIQFRVKDTGIGIAAAELQHIFEGFSQAEASTTRRFGGTGLGLAISKRLVELMGGALQVNSVAGEGSVFGFTLAFKKAALARNGRQSLAVSAGLAMSQLKVLIVDDNPTALGLLAAMTTAFGWQVEAANSGPVALAHVSQSLQIQKPFDIVFLDRVMPGMDGWETAQKVHELHGQHAVRPRLILLSSHSESSVAQVAQERMFNQILIKPVTGSMLFDAAANSFAALRPLDADTASVSVSLKLLAGVNLLVVEDNRINQQVARELLESEGAHVTLAENGQIGLDILNAGSVAVDLVLMDIQMPVMDGLTATKAIRANPAWQSLPIVAMTANASIADRHASIEAGMNDHVAKPFDLSALVKVIRRLLSPASPPSAVANDPAQIGSSGVFSRGIALHSTLHGIDIDSALARFGGRALAYARAMTTFASEAATVGDKLGAAWGTNDRGEVARLLHALKGMAGTVGAQRLTNATASMEDALHETAVLSPESFGQLRTLLQTQADAMAEIGGLILQSNVAGTDIPNPAIDIPALHEQLSALHACLQTPNLAALGLAESIREPLLAWRPQPGQKLLDAVARLDYADAQKICSELLGPGKTAT